MGKCHIRNCEAGRSLGSRGRDSGAESAEAALPLPRDRPGGGGPGRDARGDLAVPRREAEMGRGVWGDQAAGVAQGEERNPGRAEPADYKVAISTCMYKTAESGNTPPSRFIGKNSRG